MNEKEKQISNKKIILNLDDNGIHIRTNEYTVHNGESGEVIYHCKPIRSIYSNFCIFIIKMIVKFGY